MTPPKLAIPLIWLQQKDTFGPEVSLLDERTMGLRKLDGSSQKLEFPKPTRYTFHVYISLAIG